MEPSLLFCSVSAVLFLILFTDHVCIFCSISPNESSFLILYLCHLIVSTVYLLVSFCILFFVYFSYSVSHCVSTSLIWYLTVCILFYFVLSLLIFYLLFFTFLSDSVFSNLMFLRFFFFNFTIHLFFALPLLDSKKTLGSSVN
jgi:hypothetical protein